nr:MAG TPA: hypothetical protein [Caudoviricetes sp.]
MYTSLYHKIGFCKENSPNFYKTFLKNDIHSGYLWYNREKYASEEI